MSPRPCAQRCHADVRRRAELAQHGSEVLRTARGVTATPSLASTCRFHFGQFCRLTPLRRLTRADQARAAQASPEASRQRPDDVVGINRAGPTFFRRDPGSVHIISPRSISRHFAKQPSFSCVSLISIILGSGRMARLQTVRRLTATAISRREYDAGSADGTWLGLRDTRDPTASWSRQSDRRGRSETNARALAVLSPPAARP
jgi:hypothetical protein